MAARLHHGNWLFNWLSYVIWYVFMGFYQKIRNDITDRWMGLKDLQNKHKINYNVSFISLSLFPLIQIVKNWVARNTSILIVCFQDRHQNHLERCCQFNLFPFPLHMIWKFPWLQWMGLSIPVHYDSCRLVCCLWHPYISVEHFLPCTESHQVTQAEQDHHQQGQVYKFRFETTTKSLWYPLTHLQDLRNRLLSTTWFEMSLKHVLEKICRCWR